MLGILEGGYIVLFTVADGQRDVLADELVQIIVFTDELVPVVALDLRLQAVDDHVFIHGDGEVNVSVFAIIFDRQVFAVSFCGQSGLFCLQNHQRGEGFCVDLGGQLLLDHRVDQLVLDLGIVGVFVVFFFQVSNGFVRCGQVFQALCVGLLSFQQLCAQLLNGRFCQTGQRQ